MPSKYKYRPKTLDTRIFYVMLVLLIIVAVTFSYFTITLYDKTQKLSAEILTLEDEIAANEKTISDKNTLIQNLSNTIESKDDLIDQLRVRLGIAQSKIQTLQPMIKAYFVVGVMDGKGITTPLEVKITNGTGLVSINIQNVEFLTEIQDSVRMAVDVSESYLGADFSNKDITVSFVNERQDIITVDGPSAGAAITTTVIAAAANKTINDKILITGTIERDGNIGRVGGIDEKAEAAFQHGAEIFLVPQGQAFDAGFINIVEVRNIGQVVSLVLK